MHNVIFRTIPTLWNFILNVLLYIIGIALNNVAEGKPSSQSSTYKKLRNGIDVYATSDLAVDGIWDSNMSRYDDRFMCSHTDWGSPGEHWWMVNLEQTYRICKVVILNRGDWRCKYIARGQA